MKTLSPQVKFFVIPALGVLAFCAISLSAADKPRSRSSRAHPVDLAEVELKFKKRGPRQDIAVVSDMGDFLLALMTHSKSWKDLTFDRNKIPERKAADGSLSIEQTVAAMTKEIGATGEKEIAGAHVAQRVGFADAGKLAEFMKVVYPSPTPTPTPR